MVEDFILEYARLIATYPDKISITKNNSNGEFIELIVFMDEQDSKKMIGKNGKMINAIKTLISGFKIKDQNSYKITVKSLEDK